MKTLYNKNYYPERQESNLLVTVMFLFTALPLLLLIMDSISKSAAIFAISIWFLFTFYVKKNLEATNSFIKMFFLKKEKVLSKDMIFHFIDNIDKKHFPIKKIESREVKKKEKALA